MRATISSVTFLAALGLLAAAGLAGGTFARAGAPALPPDRPAAPEAVRAAPAPRVAPVQDVSAPVVYTDLMLVLVTKEGAAAVVFSDPLENGVSYKFRYESADGKTKLSGEGKVLERRLDGGRGGYDETLLVIKAGAISLRWSKGGKERGWIYYPPETVQVQLAHAKDFEDHVRWHGADATEFKALDLRRYLRK